ncbi:DUF4124 domain-containing protein [Thiocystis violacea]|uniref:DUF4124 domain-containing protein n=1 Tax=Thiocystis violacea TaxID=13725 RepID=UPI00190577B9|nr:DUF4124 domain-containing protein [Thiocystis violacea]MBK1716170.1 DUF4124 domain-containing protein [Thiocystis violacea]
MPVPRSLSLVRLLLGLTLFGLALHPAWAALYKCQQPNGRITYQQTACDGRADSAEANRLQVDIRGPDGRETGSSAEDYSVGGQAARMRAEREALTRARLKARKEAEAQRTASRPDRNSELDPAKCAKHRGEVAKWKQKVMKGYRTRSEKDQNDSKLAYHQALVDRHCD